MPTARRLGSSLSRFAPARKSAQIIPRQYPPGLVAAQHQSRRFNRLLNDRDCATWLHKAREMPKEEFKRVGSKLKCPVFVASEMSGFKVVPSPFGLGSFWGWGAGEGGNFPFPCSALY